MTETIHLKESLHTTSATAFETLSIGQTFLSRYEVTESVSYHFLQAFNDTHPIHVNETFAQARGFRTQVAHGSILNGFLSHFVGCQLAHPEVMLLGSEIAFASPVYLGDSLELRATVTHSTPAVRVAEITVEFHRAKDAKRVAFGKIRVRWGATT